MVNQYVYHSSITHVSFWRRDVKETNSRKGESETKTDAVSRPLQKEKSLKIVFLCFLMSCFHCHTKMCCFLNVHSFVGNFCSFSKFCKVLMFLPVSFVWIVNPHPLLLCPPLLNPSSFKYFVVESPLVVISPSFPHWLFSPSHHCHLWFFPSYPAALYFFFLYLHVLPSSVSLSPQDSSSSTGSAELTGNKELDELSQEIAQLQRWALFALWETSERLCFSSSELRNRVSSEWSAESVLFHLSRGSAQWGSHFSKKNILSLRSRVGVSGWCHITEKWHNYFRVKTALSLLFFAYYCELTIIHKLGHVPELAGW